VIAELPSDEDAVGLPRTSPLLAPPTWPDEPMSNKGTHNMLKPAGAARIHDRTRAFMQRFRQRDAKRLLELERRARERDDAVKRLVALERIATATVSNGDVRTFLRALLHVYLDAADRADSAEILLRDREPFAVRATTRLGDGDVRGQFDVPLTCHGAIIGVLQIGSTTSEEFTEFEKRLLLPTAERAAWAVAQRDLEQSERERFLLLERERLSRAEIAQAHRAKEDFLATVSHELRTPLNAMLGWTAIARQQAPPQMQRALAIIERNAQAQNRIIEDVLDFSHILSGTLRLEIASTDVGAAIDDALARARPDADAKGIKLSISTAEVGNIPADASRIEQVVRHVLSNAIKFTNPGGGVDVSVTQTSRDVIIRVADTGEGIDPSFLPHVFDPFCQADGSSTRRHGGLGLGLALVKQLVRAHGGTVAAASRGKGHGATFTIELPVGESGGLGSGVGAHP
jgi:signal transduction histidine kinase